LDVFIGDSTLGTDVTLSGLGLAVDAEDKFGEVDSVSSAGCSSTILDTTVDLLGST
jgi:hypothetical protein